MALPVGILTILSFFCPVQKAKMEQTTTGGTHLPHLVSAEGCAAAKPAPQSSAAPIAAALAGPAAGDTAAGPARPRAARPKAAELDAAQVQAKIMALYAKGQQQKLTLPEIKCFLRAHKVPVGGNKADLLVRVKDLLSTPAV